MSLKTPKSLHISNALLEFSSRVFIGCSKLLNSLFREGVLLIGLLWDFGKEDGFSFLLNRVHHWVGGGTKAAASDYSMRGVGYVKLALE
jgi:hypothetical protein